MPKRLALVGDHLCRWIDYENHEVGPEQVRFRTEIASGKYGTWAAISEGSTFAGRRFDQAMRLFVAGDTPLCPPPTEERPLTFGTAAIGVVTEVGAQVTRCAVGARVLGIGADIREINTVGQDAIHALTDGPADLAALCAEPAYVAFHAVREANVRFGDTVAIVGLGALGLIAVQMARQSGAERVFAVDLSAGRRALAKRFGADLVLDARAGDAALAIHEALGGPGVDVAIDLSGSYAGLETAIRSTRVAGTVCAAGFYVGEGKGLWLGREFHHNRLEMVVPHGCGWGHTPRDYPRWDGRRAYEAILSQMRRGALNLEGLISPVATPADATELFRLSRDEPDRVIKFAVRF